MQQEPVRGFRGFVQRPAGKALWLALVLVVVAFGWAYASILLAIPAFLILGLALPIYWGIKRPRFLAIAGVVVILLVAPVVGALVTQEILQPTPASLSSPSAPDGHLGSVLQNAYVTPFQGTTSTNFTWSVTVHPAYFGNASLTPVALHLYLSTCPGAISNRSLNCYGSSYLFKELNLTVPGNLSKTKNYTYTFHWTLGVLGIWDWQMSLELNNSSNVSNPAFVYLVGDPTYNGIEGPVVGSFTDVFESFLPQLYLYSALLLGLPFYFVLLLWMFLKQRERRRKEERTRAAGPIPPTSGATSATPAPASPGPPLSPKDAGPPPGEAACPNCGAVVYPGEGKCWKCGASLAAGSTSKPALESKPLPPG